jgi:hypothetical protein
MYDWVMEMDAVMPSYMEDMQKRAEQSKSTRFFTKSSLYPSTRQCASFDYPDTV